MPSNSSHLVLFFHKIVDTTANGWFHRVKHVNRAHQSLGSWRHFRWLTKNSKKKRPADDDDDDVPRKDEEDGGSDLGNSPLSVLIPVGGSVFALAALWLGVFAVVAGIAGLILFPKNVISLLLPAFWPIALLCCALSFFTHKHKASYGSITGNMRAILGILASLVALGLHGFLAFLYFKG
jgi:hypothetical protein